MISLKVKLLLPCHEEIKRSHHHDSEQLRSQIILHVWFLILLLNLSNFSNSDGEQ